jgi:acetyl-CoA carboxylase biotin carboxyl carrier protein
MPVTKSPIDADIIRSLAEILKETDLSEIEVEQKGLRVRVARTMTIAASLPAAAPAPMTYAAAPAPVDTGPGAPAARAAPVGAVTSPMVGTAYRAASPDKPNFVEIGQTVRQGQVLLIIEAMKTFNEIPAPRAGVVTEVLVGNGEPVEFGQPLVVIT